MGLLSGLQTRSGLDCLFTVDGVCSPFPQSSYFGATTVTHTAVIRRFPPLAITRLTLTDTPEEVNECAYARAALMAVRRFSEYKF